MPRIAQQLIFEINIVRIATAWCAQLLYYPEDGGIFSHNIIFLFATRFSAWMKKLSEHGL
ncbi:MAG TPA: hypothetical protein VI757_12225 [Bacteroidia bacterium]|nr:hypothetical protein [Bacteroidia bacterium]